MLLTLGIGQLDDRLVDGVAAVVGHPGDRTGDRRRHHAAVLDGRGLGAGGVDLARGQGVPCLDGHGHVPLGGLVQRRLMRTALDEAAHVLLDGGQRTLDAVIDITQDAGAEGHGQRAARALDRLACL